MSRDKKDYNICSKCRNKTLSGLIKENKINPEIFSEQSPQIKKDKDDGSNVSLSGDTKQNKGKKNKDEQMPCSVDNQIEDIIFKEAEK